MTKIIIEGNNVLNGEVKIGGAKNSAVALIPASILADGVVELTNLPEISDVETLKEMLIYLDVDVWKNGHTMKIDTKNLKNKDILDDHVRALRASYYFMGALLGKYKKAVIGFPGGCYLGPRPIDQHLKGFEALGAEVKVDGDIYHLEAKKLKGAKIDLDIASVGATINIMLAATLAEGTTVINNAAKEPEIVDVATMLNKMGANIEGAGTEKITIVGVKNLKGCTHKVVPDRIETGTYIIAGALAAEKLIISNVIPEHNKALVTKLKEMDASIETYEDKFIVKKAENLKNIDAKTEVYPGFPTDLQQPLTTLLTQAKGVSSITETIYSDRFKHVGYLNNMGANIEVIDQTIKVVGPTKLKGAEVVATDLRAGASLVLAALIAEGVTTILNSEHIFRGYEKIEEKLTNIGVKIKVE